MAKRRERNGRLVAKNDIFFSTVLVDLSLYREKRKRKRVQERNLERNNNNTMDLKSIGIQIFYF